MPAIVIEESSLNYTSPPIYGGVNGIGGISGGGGSGTSTIGIVGGFRDAFTTHSFELPPLPSFSPPNVRDLLASQNSVYKDDSTKDTFNFFETDDDLFGSPMPFDDSENGLWNGRFVPPPPRPPFLMDDPVIADGLTTCDLCSWAMPTKSTFIFEGTIEKASELGWPLTLIIVSILSAILGAIIMVTVVRCKRKKSSNRNETHVQWWSRNKRPNNNNHLRRSNIYTAHPADSIRGLHPHHQSQSNNTIDTCNWPNVTTIVVTS